MPVYKYRHVSDMPRPERVSDQALTTHIRNLWARAALLCPLAPRRGVRRFRSIEEANEDQARATAERLRNPPAPTT